MTDLATMIHNVSEAHNTMVRTKMAALLKMVRESEVQIRVIEYYRDGALPVFGELVETLGGYAIICEDGSMRHIQPKQIEDVQGNLIISA